MITVPQGTTPDGSLECVFDRAEGRRAAKRSAQKKAYIKSEDALAEAMHALG